MPHVKVLFESGFRKVLPKENFHMCHRL